MLVNTAADGPSKMASDMSPDELSFARNLVAEIAQSPDCRTSAAFALNEAV